MPDEITQPANKITYIDIPAARRATFVSEVAIGALLAQQVDQRHKDCHETQIRPGGIRMRVRVTDKEEEDRVVKITKMHPGRDVHVRPWPE